jgi:bla regulator protein blaR1
MNAALVLTALFNGAWQGAVLCTLAVFAFRLFRRLNATTMFTVWSVLLAITVALPFANYAFAPKPVVVRTAQHDVVQRHVAAAPYNAAARAVSEPPRHYTVAPVSAAPAFDVRASAMTAVRTVFHYAFWILLALAAIALVRVAILGRDVIRMLVARTRVRPIDSPVALGADIARPFSFAASDEFTSPCVLGFAPALIVIPEELLADPGTELTSVVLHEREHVRRFDDIQNVIQRFIGAVAFFCPGVRIALRELALYREQICDDAAVNATGDRVSYAMTLTDLAQWAQGRGAPVPSLIFKRKHLLHRLEVLLDSAVSHSMLMNRRFALSAATALVLAAVVVLRFQVPVIAETFDVTQMKHAVAKMHRNAATMHHTVATMHRNVRVMHREVTTMRRNVVSMQQTLAAMKRAVLRATQTVRPEKPRHAAPHPHQHLNFASQTGIVVAAVAPPAIIAPDAANVIAVAPAAPKITQSWHATSENLLDALNDSGMRNLPVDQLISLRDHGVTAMLVRSATSYFGRVSPADLTYLADHGVGSAYIATLRSGGITGIAPADAVQMMDHGVGSALIRASLDYFSRRPAPADLIFMADHGVGAPFIDSLRSNGVKTCWEDAVRMLDHGVDAAYAAKVRRSNPNASISDIIRLHDAGF